MNRSIEQQACLPKKKDESCLKSTMYGAEGIEKLIKIPEHSEEKAKFSHIFLYSLEASARFAFT